MRPSSLSKVANPAMAAPGVVRLGRAEQLRIQPNRSRLRELPLEKRVLCSRRQPQLGAQGTQRPEQAIDRLLDHPQGGPGRPRAQSSQQVAQPRRFGNDGRVIRGEEHHGLQHHADPRDCALLGRQPRTESQTARQQQIGVRGDLHHVLVSRSDIRQNQLAKQEVAAPDELGRQLRMVHAEVELHLLESGPKRVKAEAGRFHFASIIRGAGQHDLRAEVAQGPAQGDEGVQVAQRPHGGKDDFVTQCFRNSVRRCMRYCRPLRITRTWLIGNASQDTGSRMR